MFTSADKAIVALIMAVIYLANAFAGIEIGIPAETVATIVPVLTPLLVWLVPNRAG